MEEEARWGGLGRVVEGVLWLRKTRELRARVVVDSRSGFAELELEANGAK